MKTIKLNSIVQSIGMCTAIILVITGCTKKPKVISATTDQPGKEESTGIFSEEPIKLIPDQPNAAMADDIHTVTILEVLPTVKYVYLRVKEENDDFWIATNKMPVTVGEIYFYRGGLLKTNFESKEHNRIFDRMYLVSALVKSDHSSHVTGDTPQDPLHTDSPNRLDVKGSIKIADLVANPKKYEGKTIQISGKCVKINSNIMGRNWVHMQDGSKDDYDLVFTCNSEIPVGHIVTITARVTLDKDLGAGYRYAILLEDGAVVK